MDGNLIAILVLGVVAAGILIRHRRVFFQRRKG